MSETDQAGQQDDRGGDARFESDEDAALAAYNRKMDWPKKASGVGDYIKKHWRGDLSLAKSYWINAVLLSIPVSILISSLDTVSTKVYTVDEAALLFWSLAAATVFVFPFSLWQLVGTWRSAGRRIEVKRKWGWSVAARAVVLLGFIQLLGAGAVVAQNWPAYREMAVYTLGLDPIGEYTVQVIDGGSGVRIDGAISRGLVADFEDAARRAGDPAYVELDSTGGRIGVAASLFQAFQERNLATLVTTKCYSACALAFLGGSSRILADDASLGFHQAASGLDPDTIAGTNLRLQGNSASAALMRRAGVRGWFTQQAMETPNSRMWTPPVETLAEAQVITHTYDGRNVHRVDTR